MAVPVDWRAAPSALGVMTAVPLWRIYPRRDGSGREVRAIDANPDSRARLALVGTHAAWYAADSLLGALWEAPLRYAGIQGKAVLFPTAKLRGLLAARACCARLDLPLLELGQPAVRKWIPDPDSANAAAVQALVDTHDYAATHAEAKRLHDTLSRAGVHAMPIVAWPSRMFPKSTVYLAYRPPMDVTWWSLEGAPIALDSGAGYALIERSLANLGLTWHPLALDA